MKKEIIYTEHYALIVSKLTSPAKEGQVFLSKENIIHTVVGWNFADRLIIAHRPLQDAPIFEGVPLLPEFKQEDDADKLAKESYSEEGWSEPWREMRRDSQVAFKKGYNKAKETYNYTEDDLRRAIQMARGIKDSESEFEIEDISGLTEICTYGWKEKYTDNEIIQSLQQSIKRPKYFECDMARITKFNGEPDYFEPNSKPNSQGQTELVGKYTY